MQKVFAQLDNVNTARAVVLVLFLVAFAVGLGRLLWGPHYADYKAAPLVDVFLAVYSVPFSILLVGVLARTPSSVTMDPMKTALLYGATLLWNSFIVVSVYLYFAGFAATVPSPSSLDLNWALELARDKLAFLITGILTYIYATNSGTKSPSAGGDSAPQS